MRKKVLITYATAGIGHKKASIAIKAALDKKKNEDLDVRIIDVLDFTNAFLKKIYISVYIILVNHIVLVWAILYYLLDFRIIHCFLYPLRRMSHLLNFRKLMTFMLEFKPDVVISTHFLTADLCYYLRKKYGLKFHLINVITDYRAHSFWVADNIDTYIVAHEKTRMDLMQKWGVDSNRIKIMGIPAEPKFSIKHDKKSIRDKLGLPLDQFTILLMGGGYGVGPILKILKILEDSKLSLSLLIVCGHNKKLYDGINNFNKNPFLYIKNYQFVDNVDELMAASDVYVGKAGGINTTEALAQDLPIIFVRPIPGQEKRNARLIVDSDAAIRLRRIADLVDIIKELMESKEKIKLIKENINRIKRPDAASDIADFIVSLV